MTASDIIRERREEILAIARKHGAFNVRVFGSVARGEADEESDIDLLVDLATVAYSTSALSSTSSMNRWAGTWTS